MTQRSESELLDLQASEVSLVDRGANKKKRFPVFKEEQMDEILKAVIETPVDEEDTLTEYFEKAKVSDKGQNALKAALRMLSAYKDELPKDVLDKLAAAAGYPSPTSKAKKENEDEYPYPEPKAKAKVKKEDDKMDEEKKVEVKKVEDEIRKAYDDKIAALTEANVKIEKALNEERNRRELGEWVEKAKSELSYFPGKSAEEIGKSLKALNDFNPEMAKADFEEKKRISKMVAESELLKEAGANYGGGSDSSWAKIEKLSDELVQKSSDLSMSRSKAINQVLASPIGQTLYKKYLDENPRQVG
jgi:hypothetical protein